MKLKTLALTVALIFSLGCSQGQHFKIVLEDVSDSNISVGAVRTEAYLPLLKEKKVALCANHTSVVNGVHLLDTLLKLNVEIVKIFTPEHGFRGQAEAGAKVNHSIDAKTNLPLVSLYGNNKKPTAEQLKDVDIILFDIQDVGARFYTYLSTLHYIMEAAAENNIFVIVLDRPNPNGFFIDGCVLDTSACASFIGMHPVPIATGMTIGEYAKMINGEKWLKNGVTCSLKVVPVFGYTHFSRYALPIAPSPNLQTMQAVYLYPSLCLFEGTVMSVGRGTNKPFMLLGHPDFPIGEAYFTPKSIPHVAVSPPCMGKKCRGFDLTNLAESVLKNGNFINIDLLVEAYKNYPDKEHFFTSSFDKLSGKSELRQQIIAGKSASEIKESWQEDLETFKQIRKKYLLYIDFE